MYRTLYSATWAQALNWLSTNRSNHKKLAGVEGLFGPAGLTPPGPPFGRYPSSANSSYWTIPNRRTAPTAQNWLGWKDSNLRMAGSKPAALPLGDTPMGPLISELARADSQPVANLSSKGESFNPRAKNASSSDGNFRTISSPSSIVSTAKKK